MRPPESACTARTRRTIVRSTIVSGEHGTADALQAVVSGVPPSAPSPVSVPLLAAAGLEKHYGAFRPALVGVDFSLDRGGVLLVEGPGGSGKSVLLRLLSGIEAPSGGSVRVAGEDLVRMRPRARAHLRRSMGILPPGGALLDDRSAVDNVALAAWVAGTDVQEGLRRARTALETLGIDVGRHGDAPCRRLSGGQRQCVALARAIVNRPALLLLDDPLESLDAGAAARVMAVLGRFAEGGVAIVATARGATGEAWPQGAHRLRLEQGRGSIASSVGSPPSAPRAALANAPGPAS